MDKNIEQVLKEATQDMLSEESLSAISQLFNEGVDKKVKDKIKLQVEAALAKQDSEYADKLQRLLEAIDVDHTAKLEKIVATINENHVQKLKNVAQKFGKVVHTEAKDFKNTLVEQVNNYLDLYLKDAIPQQMIEEAVKNRKAYEVLTELRHTLAVDNALSKNAIKSAVIDGKRRIDESTQKVGSLTEQVNSLARELTQAKAELLLEKKTAGMPDDKKRYLLKVLGNKNESFITENFDYTVDLFDKKETEDLEDLREESLPDTTASTVDRPIMEHTEVSDAPQAPVNSYLTELKKYK